MTQPTTGATKAFASQADLDDKKITFEQLSAHCWAYTAEGDPNSGVIIGDKFIMVSDATATPAMARELVARIRTVLRRVGLGAMQGPRFARLRVPGGHLFPCEHPLLAAAAVEELIGELAP